MTNPHYKVVTVSRFETPAKSITWNFHFDFAARMFFAEKKATKLYDVDLFQGETLIDSNYKKIYPLPL